MATDKTNETELKSDGVSRRNLFQILGAAVPTAAFVAGTTGAALAEGHEGHMHMARANDTQAAKGPYQRKVFNDEQWQAVRVLCDLIIPADEKSGSATSAGVPEFIDDWLDFRRQQDGTEDLMAQIFGGLMWLDRQSIGKFEKKFVEATADQQKQILDRIAWPAKAAPEDHQGVVFFNKFRDLTVGGFFSSKVGVADLPYLGNVAVTEWKGCDPKVWAIIEERMKNGYKGAFTQNS